MRVLDAKPQSYRGLVDKHGRRRAPGSGNASERYQGRDYSRSRQKRQRFTRTNRTISLFCLGFSFFSSASSLCSTACFCCFAAFAHDAIRFTSFDDWSVVLAAVHVALAIAGLLLVQVDVENDVLAVVFHIYEKRG